MPPPRSLISDATERLRAAGVPTPRVDAELLLAAALAVPRARLALVREVDDAAAARFHDAIRRRERREPLQHVTGNAPFRHLELAVGPGVFVPRPETELLVDAVLPTLREAGAARAVDLCSGSGALALSLAEECPGSVVWAVERAVEALAWLRRNVVSSAAAARVTVVEGDVGAPGLLAELHGTVDAVVSNPPYVPDATPVEPEVHADPAAAVFAGADGLAVLPAVVAAAGDLLRAGGVVAVEHDAGHQQAVVDLFARDGRFTDVRAHADLSGAPRFVAARRGSHGPEAG